MFGKERAPSGKVVKTFLRVVVQGCLFEHRLRLLDGCCVVLGNGAGFVLGMW